MKGKSSNPGKQRQRRAPSHLCICALSEAPYRDAVKSPKCGLQSLLCLAGDGKDSPKQAAKAGQWLWHWMCNKWKLTSQVLFCTLWSLDSKNISQLLRRMSQIGLSFLKHKLLPASRRRGQALLGVVGSSDTAKVQQYFSVYSAICTVIGHSIWI